MAYRLTLVVSLICACFAGCSYPRFTHPIVEPDKAERFDELFGTYRFTDSKKEDTSWLHIGRCKNGLPKGLHKFVLVSHSRTPSKDQEIQDKGLAVEQYVGFIFKKADSYVVQIPYTKEFENRQAENIENEWGKVKIDDYLVVRFKKVDEGLQFQLLNEKHIKKLIRDRALSGRIERKQDTTTQPPTVGPEIAIVTADSEELIKLFQTANHDDMFEDLGLTYINQSNE